MIREAFLLFVFCASVLSSQTQVELSKQVKGDLPPSNGGTGLSSCGEDEVLVWQSGAFVCAPNSAGPHATTHQHGGTDQVATATPADNAIPKAGGSDAYNIIGNVFNWAGTYLSDGGTGANKNIVGNVPGVASNVSSPLLRLEAQTQFVDTGTKPSCGVSNRFVLWVEEGGSGIKDAVKICAKNSSHSYGWRVIY